MYPAGSGAIHYPEGEEEVIFCKHKWAILAIHETPATASGEFHRPEGMSYISRCQECGRLHSDFVPGKPYNGDWKQ